MFRILDRYLIREILPPLVLALILLTFILEIPPIIREGEQLIAKGVEWSIVLRVLVTLLPQALALTIPMAVLFGLLVGLGRLSGDREWVALQACGISLYRLLRPVALIAAVGTAATAYEIIVSLPNANQTFREITAGLVATRAEHNIKPHVFFEDFPNRVVYVRDAPPGGGWRDVFLADSSAPDHTDVYVAREGRLLVDRARHTVQLQLRTGTQHTTRPSKPDECQVASFAETNLSLDPSIVFPRPPPRGINESTIAELRASIADVARHGEPGYRQHFMIQQKFSIPAACLVLATVGLALGASNRKDGRLASFALGSGVIFVYYVLLWLGRDLAEGGRFPASWAPWMPDIVLGVAGIGMLLWRAQSADQPIRISIPAFWTALLPSRRVRTDAPQATGADPEHGQLPKILPKARAGRRAGSDRIVLVIRIPHLSSRFLDLARPSVLDLYIARQYLRVFLLGIVSLLGIFYISTFMDMADKLFRGSATTAMLLWYFYFETPQFVYYVIPMSALIATLVTVGLMTKNSELVVMKACGISLYRASLPLVLFSLVASAVLFGLEERVLASSNREAERLNAVIRGYPPQTFGVSRRWIVGQHGDIYHYDFFDPRANRFAHFTAYHLDTRTWTLGALTYADDVSASLVKEQGSPATVWVATRGWTRAFGVPQVRRKRSVATAATPGVTYAPFDRKELALEPPSYFKTDAVPETERMTYGQLKEYIAQLQVSGFNAIPQMVELQRRVAFPLVTLVMTLLAVPFAVTTGRRGALYGVGIGIVLAITYWMALSVFGAMGAGGLIAPALAAWAPNILFSSAAAWLILTVRT